ncbi:hypothetical protein ASE03_33425 [Kitasatospora sp. Root187]|nr:hypothetical protein ASC99_36315 [Kitasatospora sp. Root107]KRB62028.1 hypothetical protein ASE03_33425 [Kitasatospora sp. Root187]
MYTGDSPANSQGPRSARAHAPASLATASPAQQELEHQVLLHLKGGSVYAAHQLAIAHTRVLADRTEVRLDRTARAWEDHRDKN